MRDGAIDAPASCGACGPGQYCNSTTHTCAACSDLSRLQFGAPTKLSLPSAGPGANQNFPREIAHGTYTGLVYSFDSPMTGVDIAFAQGTSPMWPAGMPLPSPIAAAGIDEAPFPLPTAIDIVFLYDSAEAGVRGIYAASTGGAASRTLFGDPGTALNASGNNYHVAAQILNQAGGASSIGRLWWTTDRATTMGAGGVRLVSANRSDPLAADVPLVQANNCRTGGDVEPWVVPGGNVLFFSSLIYLSPPACTDNGDAKRRLSFTQVDPMTGQQIGRATAVGWHTTGFDDHAPSLTADMCALLFASNRDGGTDMDLYVSPRN
jgi:hypothetical protein